MKTLLLLTRVFHSASLEMIVVGAAAVTSIRFATIYPSLAVPFAIAVKIVKFLNQCFARLQCWKKCLEFMKPTVGYLLDQQLFCWRHFSKTEVVQNTDLNILAL